MASPRVAEASEVMRLKIEVVRWDAQIATLDKVMAIPNEMIEQGKSARELLGEDHAA